MDSTSDAPGLGAASSLILRIARTSRVRRPALLCLLLSVVVPLALTACGGGGGGGVAMPPPPPVAQSGTNSITIDNSVPESAVAAITSLISGADSVGASAKSINIPAGLGPAPAYVLAIDASKNTLLIGTPAADGTITLSVASTAQALAELGLEPLPSGVTYAQAINAITGSAGYPNLVTQVTQALNSDAAPATSSAVLTSLSAVVSQAQAAILPLVTPATASGAEPAGTAKNTTSAYDRRAVAKSTVTLTAYQPLPYNLVTGTNGTVAIEVADLSGNGVQLYNNSLIEWKATTADINGNGIAAVDLPGLSVWSSIGTVVTSGKYSTPVPINGNGVQFVVTVSEDSSTFAFNLVNIIQSVTDGTLSKLTTISSVEKTCVGGAITALVNSDLPDLTTNPSVNSLGTFIAGLFSPANVDDTIQTISKCAGLTPLETAAESVLSRVVASVQLAVTGGTVYGIINQTVSWSGKSFSVEVCKSIGGAAIPCALTIRTPQPFLAVGQSEQLVALNTTTSQPFPDTSALSWTATNDPMIATISPLGVVDAGKSPGVANIQVADIFGDAGTATITIGLPVVTPLSPSINSGGTVQMALVDPSSNPLTLTPAWQWFSNSPSIVTIDSNSGIATGVSPGIATVYASDPNTNATTYPVKISVAANDSATSLSANPTVVPATGGPVTFTAVVSSSAAPAGAPAPSGAVNFTDITSGAVLCAKVSLSGGSAQCLDVTVMPGDAVQASYSGDTNYAPSTGSVTVTQSAMPTVMLSANPTTVTTGNSSTLTWTSTNATSCMASGGWTSSIATSGSASTGALTATTTYMMTCSDSSGNVSAPSSVTVTVGANPWVGSWDGTITSTCGAISGPFDIVIVSLGGNQLSLSDEYGDVYGLTISSTDPNAASSTLDGGIYYTISGNSMTVSEPAACQTGSLTRQ
jgi:hypothetical protein